jgi:hypothetical protein
MSGVRCEKLDDEFLILVGADDAAVVLGKRLD